MIMIGRIYVIKSNETDKVYIGSTVKTIEQRLSGHKNNYKNFLKGIYHYVSSFEIVQYHDCYIQLLEEVNVENKQELYKIEGKYIKDIDCVNQRVEGRSRKDYMKEYLEDNKERIKERGKNYYQDNKEKILEKEKNYRDANKEKILEYKKNYYQENKVQILEKMKVKMTCECGSIVRKSQIKRHNLTLKHKKYIDNIK